MDKQQGSTPQHREYTQYPVIKHNRKEYKNEYIYMYNNHFAVQKKSSECCK